MKIYHSKDQSDVVECVEEIVAENDKAYICLLYTSLAMKFVAGVRKELSIRTIFNILGPLTNPAGAKMQVLGVYDESLVKPLCEVLKNVGVKSALSVYGLSLIHIYSASCKFSH